MTNSELLAKLEKGAGKTQTTTSTSPVTSSGNSELLNRLKSGVSGQATTTTTPERLAQTANITNRMLAGSNIMGNSGAVTEMFTPVRTEEQIRSELDKTQDELAATYGTATPFNAAEVAKKQESLKAEEAALKAELESVSPTASGRVSNALKSIGNTTTGALWSLGETGVQAGKNTVEELKSADYRAVQNDLVSAKQKLRLAEKSKNMGDTGKRLYEEALAEVERLEKQLASMQVTTSVGTDSLGQQTIQKGLEQKEAALEGTSGVGRWVGENLIGVGQNVAMLPLAAINPTLPAIAMGAVSAGSKAAELNAQGATPGEALIRGGIAGGIEALTEKIPLDNILDMVKVGGKSAIKNLLKQAGTEAGEESISYVLNYIADKAAGDPNATFSLEELANAAASGAFSGGIMGGGATLIGNALNPAENKNTALPEVESTAKQTSEKINPGARPSIREIVKEMPSEGYDIPHISMPESALVGEDGAKVSESKMPSAIRKYMNKLFRGKILDVGPDHKVYINKGGIEEFAFPVKRMPADTKTAKMTAGANLDTTLKTSVFLLNTDDDGRHADATGGWDNFYVMFETDTGTYSGIVKTKVTDRGRVFHDITEIEKEVDPATRGDNETSSQPARQGTPSSDPSVTDAEPVVNTQPFVPPVDPRSEAITSNDIIKNANDVIETPPIAPKPEPVLPHTVKKDSSVGAAPTGFDPYSDAQLKYGNLKPGENPARIVDNPASTDGENKVSQSVQTITEAQATPDSFVGDIQEEVLEGKNGFTYIPTTNKEATARAEQTIQKDGFETALREWTASVRQGLVSADLTAMGATLYNNAVNAGNGNLAIDILSDYVTMVRSGAQATQAARILKTLTPEWKLYYAQKSVQRIQEELNQKFGEGKYNITISEELANNYLAAETEEARGKALDAIYKDVAKQIPATLAEKWNAWRYFAMLANPRTHIRNVAGNLFFAPIRMVKDAIATVGESAVDYFSKNGIERTKSALNFASEADRALVKSAFADSANVEELLLGEGKYDSATDIIQDNRRIFAIGPLEAMRNFNNTALEKEDAIFSKTAYAGALAGYLKANGVTLETASKELLDKARAYAIKEAQKATYRDANALSDFVANELKFRGDSKLSKVVNVLMEGVLPFRRTPANILARGLEYSPAGLVKGLTADLVKVHKGEMTAAEAIDNISAGLTGTALVAFGFFLAKQGRVTGGESGSEEEKEMRDLTGGQNYAITFGDKNFTLDWLAPEAMPFFVGVELYNQLADKDNGTGRAMEDGWKAIGSIAAPVMEMSMLSGVQDLLESISYADGIEMIPAILSTAATNYVSQAFPTLFGQIERVGEKERQTTFVDRTSMLTNDMQYTLGKVMNKAPGEFQQIPYIDAWGRTEESGTAGEKIVGNMLAPWYSSKENVTEADKEIMRLLDAGYTGVAPDRVSQSYKVTYKDDPKNEEEDSKSRLMTADEYVEFATIKGQTAHEIVSEMIESDYYKGMSDEMKAEAIKKAYEFANHLASNEITDGHHVADPYVELAQKAKEELGLTEAEYLLLYKEFGGALMNGEKVREAYASGINVTDYLNYGSTKSQYDAKDNNSYTIAETAKAIQGSGMSKEEQTMLWLIEKPDWGEKAAEIGVSPSVYVDVKVAINGVEGDKDAKGNTISGSKKTKIVAIMNKMGVSSSDQKKILESMGFSTKTTGTQGNYKKVSFLN